MQATITRATPAERDEVYAFWYRIYVVEMQRLLDDPLTDHHRQRVLDPLATFGSLLIARNPNGQLVGTLLSTCAGDGRLGKYEKLYGLNHLTPDERSRVSITTKLMVDPALRRSRLAMLMASRGFEWLIERGVEQDYIDCNDHLLRFFTKLGYLPHRGRIDHPDYGNVNSMVINLTDYEHLKAVGSPLLRSAPLRQRRLPAAATPAEQELTTSKELSTDAIA